MLYPSGRLFTFWASPYGYDTPHTPALPPPANTTPRLLYRSSQLTAFARPVRASKTLLLSHQHPIQVGCAVGDLSTRNILVLRHFSPPASPSTLACVLSVGLIFTSSFMEYNGARQLTALARPVRASETLLLSHEHPYGVLSVGLFFTSSCMEYNGAVADGGLTGDTNKHHQCGEYTVHTLQGAFYVTIMR